MVSFFRTKTDPKFIADQLRKPSGDFAGKISARMEQTNEALFDLTLETMNLQENEELLEIGFGSGKFTERAFRKARKIRLCGIDYSPEMVKEAAFNNRTYIDSGQLKITRAGSDQIPFADESFDKVFCNMVVFFWDKPENDLKEIRRVLKPGGKFYTGIRTRESMMQFPFVQYGFNLYEPEEWTEVLRKNKFSVLQIERKADVPFEDNGKKITLESVCIAAKKES